MNTYKGVRYFMIWLQGNWYLIIPDFQKIIELTDDYNTETIEQLIECRVVQYL